MYVRCSLCFESCASWLAKEQLSFLATADLVERGLRQGLVDPRRVLLLEGPQSRWFDLYFSFHKLHKAVGERYGWAGGWFRCGAVVGASTRARIMRLHGYAPYAGHKIEQFAVLRSILGP